ncbi:MAG: UDP-N-acetylmuramoyl-L-alanine--D-glutamate ligase [bacterium]|nr:UDP-N-acetylmuramoyl-L-alanine--D-glutamate ligase [bacterium]
MNLNYLKDKKILILGFAREGIDTLRFLRRLFPRQVLTLADQKELSSFEAEARKMAAKDRNLKLHFGPDYLKKIGDYDVVIKSPGIPPKIVRPYLKKGQIATSQTEIFLENCPGKIVGVTGTKGKSTTASLIYAVLKNGGLKVRLVGNIGKPVLSLLFKAKPDDVFVYELSSHQLMNLKQSPQIAVFLNIYPEHLDYYRNFQEYLKAKQNICRYQKKGDLFLYNPGNKYVRQTVKISQAQKISLNSQKAKIFLEKCGRSDLPPKLLGEFNLLNMAAALETGRIFGIPDNKIAEAIQKFKPLSHRLELIGKYQGVKFYNDSLATIPEASIGALDALGENVETMFLGGFDRGLDFGELGKRIIKSKIKNLIFFSTSGERIWRAICRENLKRTQPKRFFNHFFVDNMKEAVRLAFRHTRRGKICLLSCASPSFGLFRDYQERGDLFKKYVRQQENSSGVCGKRDENL